MRNTRQAGFTLLELMIVVAVIAVLATIALPMYAEQIRKGKRAEAVQALGDFQLRQEKWRAEHATYGTLTDLAPAGTYNNSLKFYNVGVSGNTGTAYVITATRKGDLANDPKCGDFTMTMAAGVVTKGISSGDLAYCWRK